MRSYLITYDNRPPRDYSKLYRLMAAMQAVRLADSVWLANVMAEAYIVRNLIGGVLERDDKVAVIEMQDGSDWATRNVPAAAVAWLDANVAPVDMAA